MEQTLLIAIVLAVLLGYYFASPMLAVAIIAGGVAYDKQRPRRLLLEDAKSRDSRQIPEEEPRVEEPQMEEPGNEQGCCEKYDCPPGQPWRKCYRTKARMLHPDKIGGDGTQFKELNKCNEDNISNNIEFC